jgi:hypothetical protein
MAAVTTARSSGYSKPPPWVKNPRRRGKNVIAAAITPTVAATPRGVSSPRRQPTQLTGSETVRVEVPARSRELVRTKPADQLLGTVRQQGEAEHQTKDEGADCHVTITSLFRPVLRSLRRARPLHCRKSSQTVLALEVLAPGLGRVAAMTLVRLRSCCRSTLLQRARPARITDEAATLRTRPTQQWVGGRPTRRTNHDTLQNSGP